MVSFILVALLFLDKLENKLLLDVLCPLVELDLLGLV